MVGIGLVGIGFMGMIHYLATQRIKGGRVVALCESNPTRLAGDWTGIQGNFGPRGTHMDLSSHARYAELDDLLADRAVDLVDLCVPTDAHAALAVQALEAGKHVMVEKPISLTLADAERMLAAARSSGRMLMVAQVLQFFPEFTWLLEAVRSGRYGKLRAAHFTRVISKPDWSAAIGDVSRTGGPAIDLHIHDTHFIALLCGSPTAVHARGTLEEGTVNYLTTQYLYDGPDPPAVSAVSGTPVMKSRPFAHGFEAYLERATIALGIADVPGSGPVNPLVVYEPDGSSHPELGTGDTIDCFAREIAAAVGAVASGQELPGLAGTLAREALAMSLAEVESVRIGQAVPVS
jgi:predicted dehydrogenase